MNFRILLLLSSVGLLIAIPGYYFLNSPPVESSRSALPVYRWEYNLSQQYKLNYTSALLSQESATSESTMVHAPKVSTAISGTLIVRRLPGLPDTVCLAMKPTDLAVTYADREFMSLARHLEQPFVVTLTPEGRVLSTEFAQALSEHHEPMLRSVVELLELEVSNEDPVEWSYESKDSFGQFRKRLRFDADSKTMWGRKMTYKTLDEQQFGSSDRVHVSRSKVEAQLSNTLWLSRSHAREVLSISREGWSPFQLDSEITLEKRKGIAAISDTIEQFESCEALREKLAAGPKSTVDLLAEAEMEETREYFKASQIKLSDLLQTLPSAPTMDDAFDFENSVSQYLRAFPEQTQAIASLLKDPTLDERQQSVLIFVLQMLGTPEAMRTLEAIFSDPTQSDANRNRAIVAAGLLPTPDIKLLESLWHTYQQEFDSDVARDALLGIGAVGGNFYANNDGVIIDIHRDLAAVLQKSLAEQDLLRAKTALHSLGNTGYEGVIQEIELAFESQEAELRFIAADALSKLDDEVSSKLIVSQLEKENDPLVRRGLTAVALKHEPVESTVKFMQRAVTSEQDSAVRRNMVQYLAKHRDSFPENREVLRKILSAESDPTVYREIIRGMH